MSKIKTELCSKISNYVGPYSCYETMLQLCKNSGVVSSQLANTQDICKHPLQTNTKPVFSCESSVKSTAIISKAPITNSELHAGEASCLLWAQNNPFGQVYDSNNGGKCSPQLDDSTVLDSVGIASGYNFCLEVLIGHSPSDNW